MPIEELSGKLLADLSSLVSWRLGYERRAGCYRLFEHVPPFIEERELYNLRWWQGVEAVRLAPDLLFVIEANREEIREIISIARKEGNPQEFVEYANELAGEIEAASLLIQRLNDGRE